MAKLSSPLCGISWLRLIVLIWSSVLISGDSPPWTQRISSSIICQQARIIYQQEYQHDLYTGMFYWIYAGIHVCIGPLLLWENAFSLEHSKFELWLTAAMVRRSNTLQQYFQAFTFPYLFWHSSVKRWILINHKSTCNNVYCIIMMVLHHTTIYN